MTNQQQRNTHTLTGAPVVFTRPGVDVDLYAIPPWHTVTSVIGLGAIPIGQVINTTPLVGEANRSHRAVATSSP